MPGLKGNSSQHLIVTKDGPKQRLFQLNIAGRLRPEGEIVHKPPPLDTRFP